MFQSAGMFEFFTSGNVVLPSAIKEMSIISDTQPLVEYICIVDRIEEGEKFNRYNISLTDEAGNLFVEISDFSMIKLQGQGGETDLSYKLKF
jgi:hypothetical protein